VRPRALPLFFYFIPIMKNTLTESIDLSQVVRSKLVYLNIFTPNGTAPLNYRYYFDSDSELNNSIITGIQVHSPWINVNEPQDFAEEILFDPVAGSNAWDFVTYASLRAFTLTLVDFTGRHYWENQVLTSLFMVNTGRYPKRLYNRIKLEECYITAFSTYTPPGGTDGNNIKYLMPFTFYYIPVSRPQL